ncbi:hypothetical protein SDC9_08860 [bioreactor metagenome]|jgi:REP element-mobilizing transposase RayT|uniref:Transposase IS200-like domain-containing protein n=1 Tax=bioreactor metagenome TaxID=1076179 RepID=A0A644T8K0_9ZZZZ|nr:transposase [Lentimicrobium sp.]MEA5109457.1 transposase [Lentimicrobium sp.]
MAYNSNIHQRKSFRLKGYDYSQAGLYFITICVQDRLCLFGNVKNVEMMLNDAGRMVENEWLKLPQRYTNIELHEFVVMPNHFHAIMEIAGATLVVAQNETVAQNIESGQPQGIAPTKPKTVGDMVGAFQSMVTVEYIRGVKQLGWGPFNRKLWQRNYWEHIIRDERSYERITEYITNNPKYWDNDKFNNQ